MNTWYQRAEQRRMLAKRLVSECEKQERNRAKLMDIDGRTTEARQLRTAMAENDHVITDLTNSIVKINAEHNKVYQLKAAA